MARSGRHSSRIAARVTVPPRLVQCRGLTMAVRSEPRASGGNSAVAAHSFETHPGLAGARAVPAKIELSNVRLTRWPRLGSGRGYYSRLRLSARALPQ